MEIVLALVKSNQTWPCRTICPIFIKPSSGTPLVFLLIKVRDGVSKIWSWILPVVVARGHRVSSGVGFSFGIDNVCWPLGRCMVVRNVESDSAS